MAKIVQVKEEQAQAVLLLRAVEEVDGDGLLLPLAARGRATEDLLREGAPPETARQGASFLIDRAQDLLPELTRRLPAVPALLRATRPGKGLLLGVAGLALVLGLATDALGSSRQVNLLSLPLLGILGWNLLAYLFLLLAWLLRRRSGEEISGQLSGLVARLTGWLAPLVAGRRLRREAAGTASQKTVATAELGAAKETAATARSALAGQAVSRFLSLWRRPAAPLAEARARRLLHAAALALAAGVIAGMYLRGLVFEYQATWESTFLGAGTVSALLHVLLGPAAAILGVEIPAIEPLRGPDGAGPAALWVHLFAVTTALVVALPRSLLFAFEDVRCRLRRRRLPLDLSEAYFRRVLAAGRGEQQRVEILPYSFHPSARAAENLKAALYDVFGSRSELLLAPPLEYGELPEGVVPPEDADEALVMDPDDFEPGEAPEPLLLRRSFAVVFNLAQTPEAEVHGELIRLLRTEGEDEPLVIVDAAPFRRRLGEGAEADDRLDQRRRAWDRVLADAGSRPAHVDLDRESGADLHRLLDAARHAENP